MVGSSIWCLYILQMLDILCSLEEQILNAYHILYLIHYFSCISTMLTQTFCPAGVFTLCQTTTFLTYRYIVLSSLSDCVLNTGNTMPQSQCPICRAHFTTERHAAQQKPIRPRRTTRHNPRRRIELHIPKIHYHMHAFLLCGRKQSLHLHTPPVVLVRCTRVQKMLPDNHAQIDHHPPTRARPAAEQCW